MSDVTRILGKTHYSGREEDTDALIWSYAVHDPWPGYLIVYYRRGIVTGLTLELKDELEKDDIIRQFGSDFVITRYDTDDCKAEGGSAPVYESKNGEFEQMEYRRLGIAITFHGSKVSDVSYTNIKGPAPRSHCHPAAQK